MNSPRCDLIGVSSVFGNDYEPYTYGSLTKLLSFPHVHNPTQDIPLYRGATDPIPSFDGPLSYNSPSKFVIRPNDAVTALYNQLASMSENEKLYIYADGPVTNIALLALLYPEVLSKIGSVTVFMGRNTITDPKFQAGSLMVATDSYFTVCVL